jgi:serine/threonine-protein kinase OSR1/STK39
VKPTKSISFKIKIKTMSASSSRAHKLTMPGYPRTDYEFRIVELIGGGAHATTHKAIREINSDHFAIKIISLDHYSEADSDAVRRETRAMILHSHPNLIASHFSFDVDDHNLWLVMPYMAAGSLQSIVSYAFFDGLPENCIVVVLKETLKGLSYLHHQCHLHKDIKAGDILLDHKDNELRSIKLEGSVMSVTIDLQLQL